MKWLVLRYFPELPITSLQQNKNTMFDDKEQVFCEEKKNGLLFTGWFTGALLRRYREWNKQ